MAAIQPTNSDSVVQLWSLNKKPSEETPPDQGALKTGQVFRNIFDLPVVVVWRPLTPNVLFLQPHALSMSNYIWTGYR